MLKVAWSTVYNHPLPDGHRFPMLKYDLIIEQLLYEGSIKPDNLFAPEPLPESDIISTHTIQYWEKLKNLSLSPQEIRRTGFPLSKELVYRERVIANGTLMAAHFAFDYGVAINAAGGTHHAYSFKGEGFCLLNDIAIAANILLNKQLIKSVLILDLDVHQGNGTAEIFGSDTRVFTFSMHGKNNIFSKREESDLDLDLPDGTNDEIYLNILKQNLKAVVDTFQPDFIFYQAGVDVLSTDKLGKISLSRDACRERDAFVFKLCKEKKIPVAVSMGGGYSEKISDIVEAHCNTFREALNIFF